MSVGILLHIFLGKNERVDKDVMLREFQEARACIAKEKDFLWKYSIAFGRVMPGTGYVQIYTQQSLEEEKGEGVYMCMKCKTFGLYHRCSKCKHVFYCSAACQKLDWKVHQRMCFTEPRVEWKSGIVTL